MPFRVTNMYSYGNMGFSETWYSSLTSMPSLLTLLGRFLTARGKALSTEVAFIGSRVSLVGTARSGTFVRPGRAIGPSGGVSIETQPYGTCPIVYPTQTFDQLRACFLTYFWASGKLIAKRYIAGVPDQATLTEPASIDYTNPGSWWDAFNAWTALIKSDSWQIRVQKPINNTNETPILQWSVQDAAPALLGIKLSSTGLVKPTQSQRIVIRAAKMRATGLRSPNGVWVVDSVTAPDAGNFVIVYLKGLSGINPQDIKSLGSVRIQDYDYIIPDAIQAMAAVTHKRGKPGNSPRGRRKTPLSA